MCVCVCVCVCVYARACEWIRCVCVRVCVCVYVKVVGTRSGNEGNVKRDMRECACLHVCARTCVSVCAHVCVSVCVMCKLTLW